MPRPRKNTRPVYSTPAPVENDFDETTPADTPLKAEAEEEEEVENQSPSNLDASSPSPSMGDVPSTSPATPILVQTPAVIRKRRGRPSKAWLEQEALRKAATPVKEGTPIDGLEGAGDEPSTPDVIGTPTAGGGGRKRRGRPPVSGRSSGKSRGGPSHVTQVPLDKDGNPQEIENDEIVLPLDPDGEKKVDVDGYLKDGREYRCRTFTIKGRDNRLYMLSTEPARCIGFRDSYLFFQKHKQLFKIIMNDEEKHDMIARHIIPHSYKGRAIGVVTARSVFREFGARIIVGGRKITDDYWVTKAREEGVVEGELADPDDKIPAPGSEYNRNQYVAWHGASQVYHTGQPSVPTPQDKGGRKKRTIITEENWMYEHAMASSRYNTVLASERKKKVQAGVYDPHTNLQFYPQITQPSRHKWEKIVERTSINGKPRTPLLPSSTHTVETTLVAPAGHLTTSVFGKGLKDVDPEILETLRKEFGEEMYGKVKSQVDRELAWEKKWQQAGAAVGDMKG